MLSIQTRNQLVIDSRNHITLEFSTSHDLEPTRSGIISLEQSTNTNVLQPISVFTGSGSVRISVFPERGIRFRANNEKKKYL
jgi:hypothetical protein